MFRDPSRLGLLAIPDVEHVPGDSRARGSLHYHNAFWAKHITPAEFPQHACDFWIPYMSGYGGITILLLPNGAVYYVFSDANEFNWYNAVHEINKLKSFCNPAKQRSYRLKTYNTRSAAIAIFWCPSRLNETGSAPIRPSYGRDLAKGLL